MRKSGLFRALTVTSGTGMVFAENMQHNVTQNPNLASSKNGNTVFSDDLGVQAPAGRRPTPLHEEKTMAKNWSDKEIELTADRCKAVAHPLRLAILCLLGYGERSVGDICRELGSSQPNISQHLTQLQNQRLLKSRKEANFVYYAIADQRLSEIIAMLQKIYCP